MWPSYEEIAYWKEEHNRYLEEQRDDRIFPSMCEGTCKECISESECWGEVDK